MFNYMTVARFNYNHSRPGSSVRIDNSYTSAMNWMDTIRTRHMNHQPSHQPGSLSLYLIQFDTQQPNNPGLVIRKEVI